MVSEVVEGTEIQVVPPLVLYSHAPSVVGLAAVPVITTPIMLSAPFASIESLGSVYKLPNTCVTVRTAELAVPSDMLTKSVGAPLTTGLSLTGTILICTSRVFADTLEVPPTPPSVGKSIPVRMVVGVLVALKKAVPVPLDGRSGLVVAVML